MKVQTARLIVREITPEDAGALLRYHRENEEFERPWSPKTPRDFLTLDYWVQHLEKYRAERKSESALRVVGILKANPEGPVVLKANLTQIFRGPFQAAYLGYSSHHQWGRQGLMTEALDALVKYAFQEMNLHRVMANYVPENAGSARVLEKLGFEKEGLAKNYLQIAGEWRDHVLTSKTNSQWRSI